MDTLNEAARRLRDGDYDAALTQLLAAWDETRAHALATLIEDVSARVTAQLPPLEAKAKRSSSTAWVEVARAGRPSDVGRLVAALVELFAIGPARLPVPRLDELVGRPPDPRIAAAIITAIAGPIAGWNDKTVVRAVKLLLRHGDASCIDPLQHALAKRQTLIVDPTERPRWDKVMAAWKKRSPLPPPAGMDDVRAALATAPAPIAPLKPATLDGDALLAAIYAEPHDDERRLVYADYLSGQGDPRGELIVLQLDRAEGRGSPEKNKREKALLKAHGKTWLAGMANEVVVGDTIWERGFPAATRTKLTKLYQARASLIRPEWATFTRIRFGGASLITETMRALEEAYNLSDTGARSLGKLSPPPPLHTVEASLGANKVSAGEECLATLLALPRLRALTVVYSYVYEATVLSLKRIYAVANQKLEELVLIGDDLGDGELFAPLLKEPPGTLRVLGWGAYPFAYVAAERDAAGRWSTLAVRFRIEHPWQLTMTKLPAVLKGLGKNRFGVARVSGVKELSPELREIIAGVAERVEMAP